MTDNIALEDLISIRHGFAFKGEFFSDEPTGYSLVTPGNFSAGGGFIGAFRKFYEGPIPEDFILQPGDLIVTMTDLSKAGDTLGYGAVVPSVSDVTYLHNQRVGRVEVLRPDLIDQGFLQWILRSRPYRNEVLAGATGTTVRHTSPGRILQYRFDLPPLPEQRAIAEVLGALDDKIESNRRLEAICAELIDTCFANATSSSNVEWVPAKQLLIFQKGKEPGRAHCNELGLGTPFIRVGDLAGGSFAGLWVEDFDGPVADHGDVLVSFDGTPGRVVGGLSGHFSNGVQLVRCIEPSFSAAFVWGLMRSGAVQQVIRDYATGTTILHASAAIPHIKAPLVDAKELSSFNEQVVPVWEAMLLAIGQSATLAQLRDALLPALLSGRIRVAAMAQLVEAS